jgi:hypothetical protein
MSRENHAIANLIIGLDPFADDAGNVYICRPRQKVDSEEVETIEAPLNSPQSRKYIKAIFGPRSSRGLLSESETTAIQDMIEGTALSKPTRSITSCSEEVIEQKPLASALKKLAEQGPTVDSAGNLLPKLNKITRLHGIKVDYLTWPTTEDALGTQLAGLEEIMLLMGVVLKRYENARPRKWSVYLVEDAPTGQGVGGDGKVSGSTASPNGTSGRADTSDTLDTSRKPLMLDYSPTDAPIRATSDAQSSCYVTPAHTHNGGRS